MQQTIQPGDQMWVNLTQLIRQRVPDRKGNTLPVDVASVTYDVRDLTLGGLGLMANALEVDSTLGVQAAPNHLSCCGDDEAGWDPGAFDLVVDGTEFGTIQGIDQCTGQVQDIIGDFTSWSSANPAIATVTKGKVQGLAVGTTTGSASGFVTEGNGSYCTVVPEDVSAPINVGPYQVEPTSTIAQGTFPPGECPTGGPSPGYLRAVNNQVQYYSGGGYEYSVTAADLIIVGSRHDLGSGTSTASTQTASDGSFYDSYSICSNACPGSSGETDAQQSWTVNGIPLPHVNGVVYKCTSITIDGY